MKILLVHDHLVRKIDNGFYSTGGFSNNVLRRYLLNDVDSITLYSRLSDSNEKSDKLVRLDDEKVSCVQSKIYFSPKDYVKKKLIIKKEIKELVANSDLVILRLPSFLGFMVFDETIRQGKKYFVEMVACPWDSFLNHGSIFGKLLAPIVSLKTKSICKKAENIVYVSNEFLQNRYPNNKNKVAISNVNLESVSDDILEKRIKKIKNRKKNVKIGLIGSLNVDYKGHREAIRALPLLSKYDVELHLLGPGDKDRWIQLAEKNDVSDKVYFDGTLPGGAPVLEWMDSLDLFIMPSLTEGLPRAMIEAMSRGCPIVGMNAGGIPELINNQFVCKKKDYKAMAKKILFLLDNKEVMIKESKSNFENSKGYLKNTLNLRRVNFMLDIINKK